jgi:hypothetical protein
MGLIRGPRDDHPILRPFLQDVPVSHRDTYWGDFWSNQSRSARQQLASPALVGIIVGSRAFLLDSGEIMMTVLSRVPDRVALPLMYGAIAAVIFVTGGLLHFAFG